MAKGKFGTFSIATAESHNNGFLLNESINNVNHLFEQLLMSHLSSTKAVATTHL